MIHSMTGYGKASREIMKKKFTVEVRTLNSKTLDLNIKYPLSYREKEGEIRNLISQYLDRGKVDFWLTQEDLEASDSYQINKALVAGYYRQLKEISSQYDIPETDWMQLIFRLPDVVKTAEVSISDEEWEQLSKVIREALVKTNEFRRAEGSSLEDALNDHVSFIETSLTKIAPYEQARIQRLRERMRKGLLENFSEENIDQNRFEQEMIYYLEKLDISEEKIRLLSHCNYFRETMASEGFNGKKLNFISQEMGREINTLGSKANDADVQKLVILMKDELEKIKEQVLNVL